MSSQPDGISSCQVLVGSELAPAMLYASTALMLPALPLTEQALSGSERIQYLSIS